MFIKATSPEADAYATELWRYHGMTQKQVIKEVRRKFGYNSIIRRRSTSEEWVEYYKEILQENIDASAPKIILDKIREKLNYWSNVVANKTANK